MEGIVVKKFFRPILWGSLIILFLVSPSFSQPPPEKNGTLSIQKIEVTKTDQGSRVVIEGSRPFEYSATKLENPLRVVVDLPDAQLGKLVGPIQVQDGIVNVIRNSQIDGPNKIGARVEVDLEQNVDYNLLTEGNVLYLDLARPTTVSTPIVQEKVAAVKTQAREKGTPAEKPTKRAKFLKDLEISAKADWVRVEIRADGLIPDYKSFQLKKPSRLVVDLPGLSNAYPKKSIDVGSKLLNDIRIGQHPNRLRVVFTFPGPQFPPSQLTKEGQNLIVLLGRMQEEVPQKDMAPAAEVAKTTRVAEGEPKEEVPKPEAAAPAPAEKPAMEQKEPMKELKPAEEAKPTVEEKPPAEPKPPAEVKAAEEVKPPAEVKVVERPLVTRYKGQKVSLDFKDADVHNILRLIGEVSNLNIITSDEVKGKITIRLMSVPWDQALEVILSTKNLMKIEEGNIIRIATVYNVRK
jgi:type IV pilus assembly protein PilQ